MTDEQSFDRIREEYRDLVLLVGLGFHPDTPHDGYEPPLLQITEAEYVRWIDHVRFAFGEDAPYDEGMKVFEMLAVLDVTEEQQGRLRMEALDRIIARRTKTPDPTIFAEYAQDPDRDPETSYNDWLWNQVSTQLDILADSTRRLHHVLGPLQLAVLYGQELERIQQS